MGFLGVVWICFEAVLGRFWGGFAAPPPPTPLDPRTTHPPTLRCLARYMGGLGPKGGLGAVRYTHFEKLLANVDATFAFVQINPGHRPLRKLRAASRSGPPPLDAFLESSRRATQKRGGGGGDIFHFV